jgi:hypothetical protein
MRDLKIYNLLITTIWVIPWVVGRRLVRRRWSRNPEVCSLVTWACGLLICRGFAATSLGELSLLRYRWDLGHFGDQIVGLVAAGFQLVYLIAAWVLIRAAIRALDTSADKAHDLTDQQIRALFPVVRTFRWIGKDRMLVVSDERILTGVVAKGALDFDLFEGPFTRHFVKGVQFNLSGAGELDASKPERADRDETPAVLAVGQTRLKTVRETPRVVVDQVGVVGPGRHWRRLRFISPSARATFWVPVNDLASVRSALRVAVPDGVEEREFPRRSLWERFLFLSFIASVLLTVALRFCTVRDDLFPSSIKNFINEGYKSDNFMVNLCWQLLSVAYAVSESWPLVVMVLYLVTGWEGWRSPLRPRSPATRPARKPATGRAPFRSTWLGWGLKLAGLVYTVVLFGTPVFDPWRGEHPGLWSLLVFPCGAFIYVGHHLCRRSFAPGAHPDPRPPFLFLRAFSDDDRTTFQPRSWLAAYCGLAPNVDRRGTFRGVVEFAREFYPVRWFRWFLGNPSETVEECLADGVGSVGPLVAIGRPRERQITSGADRMYVPDDRWMEVVLSYLGKAAGVILQPSLTGSVLWEIEQTLLNVSPHRILLSMVNYQGRPDEYERLWVLFREKHQVILPRAVPYLDVPCLVYFNAAGLARIQPVVYYPPDGWTFYGSAVQIRPTMKAYLAGIKGDPDPAPTFGPGSDFSYFEITSALVVTTLFLLLVSVGLP